MDEKILYTSLLKGAVVGSFRYADNLASRLADLIEKTNAPKSNVEAFTSDLIYYYGDMLEENEEHSLESAVTLEANPALPVLLRSLEAKYDEYFMEMLSRRREKVETVYNDVTLRSKVFIEDDDIYAIKKCESLGDAQDAGLIFKKIVRQERNATIELYKKTIHSVENHVVKNSGEKDDAPELWSISQCEFRRKLDKKPAETGYYQWRPADSAHVVKASIFTFFIGICKFRWLDALRKKATENKHQKALYEELKSEYHDQTSFESYQENELLSDVVDAIEGLGSPCREVLKGKWFGGDYSDGQASHELKILTDYSKGTIYNMRMTCLEKLRVVLNQ